MGNINDKKVFIFNNIEDAEALVGRFAEGYTSATPNNDSSSFLVAVNIQERHLLTQEERETMVIFPDNFYTNE